VVVVLGDQPYGPMRKAAAHCFAVPPYTMISIDRRHLCGAEWGMSKLADPSAATKEPLWQERHTRRDEIEGLLAQSYDPSPDLRRRAVHALCPCSVKANDDRIWDRLLEMAKDEDAKVRADVFHTLCDGSPRSRQAEIVAALERMQQDPDLKLRRRVRKLLGHYRATGEINIL
jgi:hypothetical protein